MGNVLLSFGFAGLWLAAPLTLLVTAAGGLALFRAYRNGYFQRAAWLERYYRSRYHVTGLSEDFDKTSAARDLDSLENALRVLGSEHLADSSGHPLVEKVKALTAARRENAGKDGGRIEIGKAATQRKARSAR